MEEKGMKNRTHRLTEREMELTKLDDAEYAKEEFREKWDKKISEYFKILG